MLLEEIAERLGCTYSNASWLLRHGVLHGVKENGHWVVTEEDISEYIHREKSKVILSIFCMLVILSAIGPFLNMINITNRGKGQRCVGVYVEKKNWYPSPHSFAV